MYNKPDVEVARPVELQCYRKSQSSHIAVQLTLVNALIPGKFDLFVKYGCAYSWTVHVMSAQLFMCIEHCFLTGVISNKRLKIKF